MKEKIENKIKEHTDGWLKYFSFFDINSIIPKEILYLSTDMQCVIMKLNHGKYPIYVQQHFISTFMPLFKLLIFIMFLYIGKLILRIKKVQNFVLIQAVILIFYIDYPEIV